MIHEDKCKIDGTLADAPPGANTPPGANGACSEGFPEANGACAAVSAGADGACASSGANSACSGERGEGTPCAPSSAPPTMQVFEPEVRKHHRRKRKFLEFTHSSTKATMIMLAAAVVAIIIENTPALPYFADFWHSFELGFSIGGFSPHMSIGHFINDFLMALFFLLVGLEIKFEMTAGELTNPRKALLPIVAAAGGAIVPAIVYTVVNVGSGFERGWGVPMANDIAFCLGVLALLGDRVPLGLRAFLSTLTIADDMIAILVIAVFYTAELNVIWLAAGLALFGVLLVLNRLHIYDIIWYLLIGLVMWACFLMSGVHATLAGVLLALAIPARSQVKLERAPQWFVARARSARERYDPGEPDIVQKEYLAEIEKIGHMSRMTIPPITRLDYRLHIPVYFFILPLFAFSNAAVPLGGMDLLAVITSPVFIGVFFGLFIGKPAGIFLATWITVKLKLSDLPEGVNWGHIAGVSVLGGVGFTMAIFVTNLAFTDATLIAIAKVAILTASVLAGIFGFVILRQRALCAICDDEEEGEGESERAV